MKHKVVDLNNKVIDEIEIKDSIFCINIFPDIIHNYIKYLLIFMGMKAMILIVH